MIDLSFACHPDCSTADNINEDSYKDINSYSNPDFYKNCNFKDPNFKWDVVQWNQISPGRIKDVPPKKLKYSELSEEQRKGKPMDQIGFEYEGGMTPEQIAANFDNIKNLNEVGRVRAQIAIKETYGISTQLVGGARIKDGVLVGLSEANEETNHKVRFSKERHKDGFFEVTKEGKIIFRGVGEAKTPRLSLEQDDSFLVEGILITTTIQTTEGAEIPLTTGKIEIRDGKIYIPAGEEPILFGFKAEKTNNPVRIYSNGEKVDNYYESYVIFGENNLMINSQPNEYVNFRAVAYIINGNNFKRNPSYAAKLLHMFRKEGADDGDLFRVSVYGGDQLTIENRGDIIPLVSHSSSDDGSTTIQNGRIPFSLDKDGFSMSAIPGIESVSSRPETVAMQIITNSKPDETLTMNAYDQFVLSKGDTKNQKIFYNQKLYGNAPISVYVADNELQSMQSLKEKYPSLKLTSNKMFGGEFPAYMIHQLDVYFSNNPEHLKRVDYIRMYERTRTQDRKRGFIRKSGDQEEVGLSPVYLDPYSSKTQLPFRPMTPEGMLLHEIGAHGADRLRQEKEKERGIDTNDQFQTIMDNKMRGIFETMKKDDAITDFTGKDIKFSDDIYVAYLDKLNQLSSLKDGQGNSEEINRLENEIESFVEVVERRYQLPSVYALHGYSGNKLFVELAGTTFEEDPQSLKYDIDHGNDLKAWVLLMERDGGNPHPQYDYIMENYCRKNPSNCEKCKNYGALCEN